MTKKENSDASILNIARNSLPNFRQIISARFVVRFSRLSSTIFQTFAVVLHRTGFFDTKTPKEQLNTVNSRIGPALESFSIILIER